MSDQPGCLCSICEQEFTMTDLRTRIAAVIEAQHVSEFQGGIHPEDVLRLADAVIAELGEIPDREFDDPWGHHWEWCGGVTGTWAWRITRLEVRR
jgi:hypothetical protein